MRRYMYLTSFFLLLVILVSCSNFDVSQISDEDIDRITDKIIVCNPPYIRYASGCCLDTTGTGICDRDEGLPDTENKQEKAETDTTIDYDDVADDKDVKLDIEDAEFIEEEKEKSFIVREGDLKKIRTTFVNFLIDTDHFILNDGYGIRDKAISIGKNYVEYTFTYKVDMLERPNNFEYFQIKLNGTYDVVEISELNEVFYIKWKDVAEEKQTELMLQCIKDSKIKYYTDSECCEYQNKILGNIFAEHKDLFHVNCDHDLVECKRKGIAGYPTWIINNNMKYSIHSLNEIAEFIDCKEIVLKKVNLED